MPRSAHESFALSMFEISPRHLSARGRAVAWLLTVLIAAVFHLASLYMALATFAYGCLILGLIERKKRNFHMSLMLTGIFIDISLVLILELSRSAIATTTGEPLSVVQYTHITVSLLAVLLYVPIVIHGYLLLGKPKTPKAMRSRHVKMGISAFVLRTIGWFTMFSFLNY